jgi:hypothetical protein
MNDYPLEIHSLPKILVSDRNYYHTRHQRHDQVHHQYGLRQPSSTLMEATYGPFHKLLGHFTQGIKSAKKQSNKIPRARRVFGALIDPLSNFGMQSFWK